jgi:hypothetical protein
MPPACNHREENGQITAGRSVSVSRQLTSHRVNGCNDSIRIDVGSRETLGGAPADYFIAVRKYMVGESPEVVFDLHFQDGPINEVGSNGVTHEVLLAIVIDRLQCFQRGKYSCRENAIALTKLEEAAMWLRERTRARLERGVEGTHKE